MGDSERKAITDAAARQEPPSGAQQDEPTVGIAMDAQSVSLAIIAIVAAVAVLHYGQSVLIPIVLAVLISYALSPLVSALARIRVPRTIGAAIAIIMLISTIGVGVYTLSDEAMSIVSNVPVAARKVRDRVIASRNEKSSVLTQVQQAATEIEKTAEVATVTPDEAKPEGRHPTQRVQIVEPAFRASDYLWIGGVGLVGFIGQFVVILFLAYFLLVAGDLYKRKLVKIAGPTLSNKRVTVQILDEINQQIESFIKVQVLTNAIVAIATGAALWWLGVENFAMWGLLAGLFNSIPYLGPVVIAGGLAIVSFMQFDDLLRTTYVCGITFAITSLEGYLLAPALMGRTARMNPVAIFVGLLFWTLVWGAWGTILAVPMLMMLKAIVDRIDDLQPIGELLGE